MINLKENITNFFLVNGFKDLNISGLDAMAKLGLDFDNLFDYAADKFYPVDCFIVTLKVADLNLLKDAFIVDEAMWYEKDLADDPKLVEEIVGRLCRECNIPITCKMRVTDNVDGTIAFAQMLERCGCAMITIHGRTKGQVSVKNSPVNWSSIARIVFVVT